MVEIKRGRGRPRKEIKMALVKKKVGRPPKAKSLVEKLYQDEDKALAAAKKKLADVAKANRKHKSDRDYYEYDIVRDNMAKIPSLESRIAKLERILEDAVNAGRKLHEKIEDLQKTHKKGWVPHDGDTQPVHNDSLVTVLLRNGDTNGPHPAWRFLWKDCGAGTIVAYKVD